MQRLANRSAIPFPSMPSNARREYGSQVVVMMNGRHVGKIVGRSVRAWEPVYDVKTAERMFYNVEEEFLSDE